MSYLDRDTFGIYRDRENSGPGPALMGADTLIGEDVYNLQEEDLGDIKEIMIDMRSGQIAYAVLSFGGILGMGAKLFAVPWESLQLDTVNKRFLLDASKEHLENAPGFDQDNWPDMASDQYGTELHSFYGTNQNLPGRLTASGSVMGGSTETLQSDRSVGQSGTFTQGGNLSGSSGNLSGQRDLSRQFDDPLDTRDTRDTRDSLDPATDPYRKF